MLYYYIAPFLKEDVAMDRETITKIVRILPEWDSGTVLEIEYEDGTKKRISLRRPEERGQTPFKKTPAPPPLPAEEYNEGFWTAR